MKKFIKKLILLVSMITVSASAYAYDFEVDGIYYNIISIPNETCAVTKSPDSYKGVIKIPSEAYSGGRTFTVVSIEPYAFENNIEITEVQLGNNLKQIGACAFANCSNIKKVMIFSKNCDSAGTLENPAFKNCLNINVLEFGSDVISVPKYLMVEAAYLDKIQFGENIRNIGDYAFYSHPEIKEILLSNSLQKVGKHSFENCNGIVDLILPDDVVSLDEYAFAGCKSLKNIKFPKSLQIIYKSAFESCEKINQIDFSNCNLLEIGESAFYNCSDVKKLCFSQILTKIGDESFGKNVKLQSISIPESVISIGFGAFEECSSLLDVTCYNCKAKIGKKAFYGTSSLTKIDLGNNISSIGEEAFKESNIESITIPNSVSVIYPDVFDSNLKSLIIADGDNPIKFEMNQHKSVYSTYSSYDSAYPYYTSHYITYYTGKIAPNVNELYLGRNIDYGPSAFYNSTQTEIYCPLPPTLKVLTLGLGFNKITKGFKLESNVAYYKNQTDYNRGSKSYAKCTKIKASIVTDSIEEIRIINIEPPIPYTDWIGNSYTYPNNTNLFSDTQYKKVKLCVPVGYVDKFKKADVWENFWCIEGFDAGTGIQETVIEEKEKVEIGIYDLNGRRVSEDYDGIIIIRYSDGSTRKLLSNRVH